VLRGRGSTSRGGAHVGDAKGHAPTLTQTRKRQRRSWGKMAPSGLKAVVGESECLLGAGLWCPLGVGGSGVHGLWEPRTPQWGVGGPGWAPESLTFEGAGGDLVPAGRLGPQVPQRNKFGGLGSRDSEGPTGSGVGSSPDPWAS
jgi:hypothetical protein